LEVITAASKDAPHFQKDYAIFDFTPVKNDLQGYFWEFPSWREHKPAFNVGVYDARIAPKQPKARLLHVLKAGLLRLGNNLYGINPKGYPIHLFRPDNQFSIQRMLLVGDALGADPLFGEGIGPALGYGKIAAQTIQHAFDQDDFSFHSYRRRVLGSSVGRYLVIRSLGAGFAYRFCHRSGFMHLLWQAGKLVADSWPKPPRMW
jgi:flavin-dependent dehydrogenase